MNFVLPPCAVKGDAVLKARCNLRRTDCLSKTSHSRLVPMEWSCTRLDLCALYVQYEHRSHRLGCLIPASTVCFSSSSKHRPDL